MFIKAFVFPDLASANAALELNNNHFGIPRSEDSITVAYTKIKYSADENLYFITFDSALTEILSSVAKLKDLEIESVL